MGTSLPEDQHPIILTIPIFFVFVTLPSLPKATLYTSVCLRRPSSDPPVSSSTRDQIRTMNPNYMEHKFPQIKPHPFNKVFRKASPDAIDLISALLEYTPTQRLSAIDAMVQPFFDELRDPSTRLPDS